MRQRIVRCTAASDDASEAGLKFHPDSRWRDGETRERAEASQRSRRCNRILIAEIPELDDQDFNVRTPGTAYNAVSKAPIATSSQKTA